MHLLLRRSQRDDGWLWTDITFIIDPRLDLTPEEEALFNHYNLRSLVVYDSDARNAYADAAYEHFDAAAKTPFSLDPLTSLQNTLYGLWSNIAGAANAVMMIASLRITLGDLIDGTHIESEDLEQILLVEAHITGAAQYLADYFAVALTFAGSEEQLLEL